MTSPDIPIIQHPTPEVRLTRSAPSPRRRQWGEDVRPLFEDAHGLWRVTGPAGSGVSSLLVDVAAARIRQGADPSRILLLTGSKESARRLTDELYDALSDGGFPATGGTMVRSIHSFAYALLRLAREGNVELMPGAEHDTVIRDLLAGHADQGGLLWPEDVRPALRMVGFARQLRDFLLRVQERGLGPEELENLGKSYDRPMWVSAGGFLREYQQVMNLRQYNALSASELLTHAVREVQRDPGILPEGWDLLAVDDTQNLDPMAAQLIDLCLPRADLGILAGDPEQAIFSFRGAEATYLTKHACDVSLEWKKSKRTPERQVIIVDTPAAQWERVTGEIRRAHLLDGVPWSEIAVVVRSHAAIRSTRQALLLADIPVHQDPTDVVLAQQPIVAGMILVLRALQDSIDAAEWEQLLLGPFGGADPVTIRRLLRGLRRYRMDQRAIETLAELVDPRREPQLPDVEAELRELLTPREYDILQRVQAVLAAGHVSRERGDSAELILWELWNAAGRDPSDPQARGLAEHLQTTALRGGALGSQADRDLDAIMALFDLAGDMVERNPSAGVDTLISEVSDQELPTGVRDRRGVRPEAVSLLTAHGTAGQEWRRVIVLEAQEGVWPAVGETGTLFQQEELVDLVGSGIEPGEPISRARIAVREERRLFGLATTRATEKLLLCVVENAELDEALEPTRFLDEFVKIWPRVEVIRDHEATGEETPAGRPTRTRSRYTSLNAPEVVAELRRVLVDPEAAPGDRNQAIRQLARLAKAGVPGAHPDSWWATTTPSTEEPVTTAMPMSLSPSRIEALQNCPLNAFLSRTEDPSQDTSALSKGIIVHAYAEMVARGADKDKAREIVTEAWERIHSAPAWRTDYETEEWQQLLQRLDAWMSAREPGNLLGVEVDFCLDITETTQLKGQIDRLERNEEGAVIVDIKSGKNAVSKTEADEHAQLRAYQLAVSEGIFEPTEPHRGHIRSPKEGEKPLPVALAGLLYPGTNGKSVKSLWQEPLSEEVRAQLRESLPRLAEAARGPSFDATPGEHCTHCPFTILCPAQPEGRSSLDLAH